MNTATHVTQLRVRYSETDQMGTFYNSRALEWFECGRSELMRSIGIPYAVMEERGFFLPVVEAHILYPGRAHYDDLLEMSVTASFEGRARLRCAVDIVQAASRHPVTNGYTIHAFINREGRPVRPPAWFAEALAASPKVCAAAPLK